jgi:hypothetical protein
MFCYGFPNLGSPLAVLRFPHDLSPSYTLWIRSRPTSFPTPPNKTHNLQHPWIISNPFHTGHVVAPIVLGCVLLRPGPLQIQAWQIASPDGFQPSTPFHPMLKPQHRSKSWSTRISKDGRLTLSTLTQGKLNIIKMKDLHGSQDCMAKQIYPCMIPNPKVWGLGNNIKACRPMCILEKESI